MRDEFIEGFFKAVAHAGNFRRGSKLSVGLKGFGISAPYWDKAFRTYSAKASRDPQ